MSDPKQPAPAEAQLPDAFSLFKPSWAAFRRNMDTFVLQLLFPFGLVLLTVLLFNWMTEVDTALAGTLTIIAGVAALVSFILMTTTLIITELHSVKERRVSFEQVFKEGLHYAPRLIGLLVICAIVITVGFILLIVPGLFAVQRLLLAPYFLVDKNMRIMEALKASVAAGKKHSSAVWGVAGIVIAINVIGVIPIVGWAASAVLTVAYLCAPAIRYLQVKAS